MYKLFNNACPITEPRSKALCAAAEQGRKVGRCGRLCRAASIPQYQYLTRLHQRAYGDSHGRSNFAILWADCMFTHYCVPMNIRNIATVTWEENMQPLSDKSVISSQVCCPRLCLFSIYYIAESSDKWGQRKLSRDIMSSALLILC